MRIEKQALNSTAEHLFGPHLYMIEMVGEAYTSRYLRSVFERGEV